MHRKLFPAFTLIELLIVVAIIAILAAIAVPNFLEAQTRSKVSRVRSDMRTLDTALTSYYTDNNHFPLDVHGIAQAETGSYTNTGAVIENYMAWHCLTPLTTPVAYMTSVSFRDPFSPYPGSPDAPFKWENIYSFQYYDMSNEWCWGRLPEQFWGPGARIPSSAMLISLGPDTTLSQGEWAFIDGIAGTNSLGHAFIYDPTNGTTSFGDIVRGIGGLPPEPGPTGTRG